MAGKSLYNTATQEVFDLFADYIEGAFDRPYLVIASNALSDQATNAIERSLNALGYHAPAYSVVQLDPENAPCALDESALLMLIEGIDPLRVICADAAALQVLSRAYRTEFTANTIERLWGRTAAFFDDLDGLIRTENGKRTAWELFKALPNT